MKQGINLAIGRKRVDYALRKVYFASVAFFLVTVVVSLSLIAYRLILKGSYDALEAEEQSINSQLLANQDKKDKFIETKSRLVDIKSVLTKRSPITVRLDTLSSVLPPASEVNSLSGTQTDIQMTLESDDLASLNALIEQKIVDLSQDRKKGIKKVEMRSFGLNPKTLRYQITLGITFI